VNLFRTFSTLKLIAFAAAVVAAVIGGSAIAIAARGSGPVPPARPLAQAIHDALAAPKPNGVTARITFTNNLFPSGALTGQVGSALMTGASGRLWLRNDGRGRLELQSSAGDVQVVWTDTKVTFYDASSNTVYSRDLPKGKSATTHKQSGPPSLARIADFLTKAGSRANVSAAQPTDVAGRPAYRVSVSPKHDGGLLGSVQLAWDAVQGVPLRVAIYAQGSQAPVLALEATQISYGSVPASDVAVAPPAGAKHGSLGPITPTQKEKGHKGAQVQGNKGAQVKGINAVKAAAGFPVVAPDTLVGLPRKATELVGGSKSKTVLVVYGQGLGAIVLAEHKADAKGNQGPLTGLPSVSLAGVTGHELATQLGTVIAWDRGGVAFVLAGSLPSAAAETAARDLK
jgi:outer membrane lipoprotein-sorting protein